MRISKLLLENIEKVSIKKKLPQIQVGDLIELGISVHESGKERIQSFRGIVIACHKAGFNTTITVRRVIRGIGVERIFPINAPCIMNLKILQSFKKSSSKLYYTRKYQGKSILLKEKNKITK